MQSIYILLFLCFAHIIIITNATNPINGQPNLNLPNNNKHCDIPLISVSFYFYDETIQMPFSLSSDCLPTSEWTMLVLTMNISIKGLQYDRVGAVWINGVEVIRLTTAEPTAEGIHWTVQKDISYLKRYITANIDDLYTTISIPNIVNSVYTGILYVNLTLSVYMNDYKSSSYDSIYDVYIHPLSNAPVASPGFPLGPLSLSGHQNFTYSILLPEIYRETYRTMTPLDDLIIEIFASAHGDEEFYWSDAPGEVSSIIGTINGTIYREIRVYIDNILVNAIQPFNVLYTGGVDPYLWRPLTGIYSFDIPAYKLDLSPFLGLLLDNGRHEITVVVYGNTVGGSWFVDCSLHLTPSSSHTLYRYQDIQQQHDNQQEEKAYINTQPTTYSYILNTLFTGLNYFTTLYNYLATYATADKRGHNSDPRYIWKLETYIDTGVELNIKIKNTTTLYNITNTTTDLTTQELGISSFTVYTNVYHKFHIQTTTVDALLGRVIQRSMRKDIYTRHVYYISGNIPLMFALIYPYFGLNLALVFL